MATITIEPASQNNRFLLRNNVIEKVDFTLLRQVQKSTGLREHWDDSDKAKFRMQCYKNEKQQINDFGKRYNEEKCGVPVDLHVARSGFGRAFAAKACSYTFMRKDIRHTLCDDLYYDIDLVNAQVNILYYVLKTNNLSVPPTLEKYAMERDSVLSEVSKELKVEKDIAKELFLRLMFFGTYEGFRTDHYAKYKVHIQENCPSVVRKFQDELKPLVPVLKESNPLLWTAAKNSRLKTKTSDFTKVGATFMSLYLQSYEFFVVDTVCSALNEKTDVFKADDTKSIYCVYEYDGIKLLKSKVDAHPNGLQGIINSMNKVSEDVIKMPLIFAAKAMNRRIDLTENPLTKYIREMCIIEKNHIEAVRKVVELNDEGSIFDRKREQWYSFNKDKNKWEMTDHFLLKDYYDTLKNHYGVNCGKSEQYDKAYESLLRNIGNSAFSSGFSKCAKLELSVEDGNFDKDDVINFANGVYEISTNTFRERTKEDRLLMSTRFDLVPYCLDETKKTPTDAVYEKEVREMIEKIWPEEDLRELMLVILASGFVPVNVEKFILFCGKGRNGKGVINNFMQLAGGDYVLKCNANLLTVSTGGRGSSQEASSYMADLDKIRYAYATEPPSHTPIANSTVKEITGAVKLRARRLYKEPIDVQIDATLVLETNVKPPFQEKAEDADILRTIDCPFISQFTAVEKEWDDNDNVYPLNPMLKNAKYVEDRRNAFLNILIPYIQKLKNADYKLAVFVPERISLRSALYCNESVPYYSIFFQLYGLGLPKPREVDSFWDKDPTILEVVNSITGSEQWGLLERKVRTQKSNSRECMKSFFESNFFFKKYFYVYKKQKFLRGWRRRIEIEEEYVEDEDDEYDEEYV
jgi:hypothetical protein